MNLNMTTLTAVDARMTCICCTISLLCLLSFRQDKDKTMLMHIASSKKGDWAYAWLWLSLSGFEYQNGRFCRLREMGGVFAEATCLAIACPACMTKELAMSCASYTTTIINGHDMIPSLSPGTVLIGTLHFHFVASAPVMGKVYICFYLLSRTAEAAFVLLFALTYLLYTCHSCQSVVQYSVCPTQCPILKRERKCWQLDFYVTRWRRVETYIRLFWQGQLMLLGRKWCRVAGMKLSGLI